MLRRAEISDVKNTGMGLVVIALRVLVMVLHEGDHLVIPFDTAPSGMRRAAPEMGLQDLAATSLEGPEIGIDGVKGDGELGVGESDVAVEIERLIIPVRVVVDHEFEKVLRRGGHRTSRVAAPTKFRSGRISGID